MHVSFDGPRPLLRVAIVAVAWMERSEIRGGVAVFAGSIPDFASLHPGYNRTQSPIRSGKSIHVRDIAGSLLVAAPLDRRWNSHRLAVFGDGSACNVDAGIAQVLDNCIVRHNVVHGFRVDELLDAVSHGFCRMS